MANGYFVSTKEGGHREPGEDILETEYGALTDKEKEEVEASIDLNKLLCDQPYSLNYETSIRDEWNGYSNMFCKINSVNSFGYLYNTTAKTLSFCGGAWSEICFKR